MFFFLSVSFFFFKVVVKFLLQCLVFVAVGVVCFTYFLIQGCIEGAGKSTGTLSVA